MLLKFLEAGKIVGTHGVRGEIKVQPWCDTAEFLAKFKKLYFDNNGCEYITVKSRVHGNMCLVKADGVDSIESAEKLRGRVVYIDRADCNLPKGSYFISDIIGCNVFDADTNEEYGVVVDVLETGANDVWQIKRGDNEYYIPNVPTFVKQVDIENKKVCITPLKGTFSDED